MNQPYKATNSQYAVPPTRPIWGGKGGVEDPMFEKYPSISPYTYCANNPVIMIDPDGKRVFAYDKTSKKYMKSYFKEQFGSNKMFRFNINNELKINNRQYNKALDNANPNQKILLDGIRDVIKNPQKAYVQITENDKFISFYPITNEETILPSYTTLSLGGGGATSKTDYGYIAVGVCNEIANNTEFLTDELNNDGSTKMTGKNASVTFMHELLDEALNFFMLDKTKSSSPQKDKVSYMNAALRNLKFTERNGIDHDK